MYARRFNQFLDGQYYSIISALSINISKYVEAKNTILNKSIRTKLKYLHVKKYILTIRQII